MINVKLVDVVEALLVRIDSAKDVDVGATDHGRVAVSRLGRRAIGPMNFIPIVGQEAVLEDVIHRVVPVPPSEDEHRVLIHHGGVAESVERLDAFTLYFFPLVLLVFDAAFEEIAEALLAIVASVDVEATIPEHNRVICSLTRHLATLQRANIIPLLLGKIVVKEILIKVATLLLIASKKV